MSIHPRVAVFTDSYLEANGVARTTGALEAYAARRGFPLMIVHAGPTTRIEQEERIARLSLQRSRIGSFGIEHDLQFDLALWRYVRRVKAQLLAFAPDVIHFTGPSDIGQLGAYLGHTLGIPMVGSWHTNLHEYASRRLQLRWLPAALRARLRSAAERETLLLEMLFYKIPRAILAPNDELVQLIAYMTRKPTFLMSRGVDTAVFSPRWRRRRDERTLNVGFVGRLSPEKSVRVLAELEQALEARGHRDVQFTIVGDGSERQWLKTHMRRASFTGVLRGKELAAAYAAMDLFVFPSQTETVGNVVLEALASGVPVVTMAQGGPRFVAGNTDGCVVTADHPALIEAACAVAGDPVRRQRMREGARAHAETLSWDRIFDDVYQVYGMAVRLAAESTAGRNVPLRQNQPAS